MLLYEPRQSLSGLDCGRAAGRAFRPATRRRVGQFASQQRVERRHQSHAPMHRWRAEPARSAGGFVSRWHMAANLDSVTMEIQDVPAICAVARPHGIITALDNTYLAGVFSPDPDRSSTGSPK